MSIATGTVTTTPGTPISLGSAFSVKQIRASWLIVQWKSGNTGNMYVGGNPNAWGGTPSPRSTNPFSSNVPAITNGNSISMPWVGSPGHYALDQIFVDSDNAGAVLFIFDRG